MDHKTGKFLSVLEDKENDLYLEQSTSPSLDKRVGNNRPVVWKSQCDPSDAFSTVLIRPDETARLKFGLSAAWFVRNLAALLKDRRKTQLSFTSSQKRGNPTYEDEIEEASHNVGYILEESVSVLKKLMLFSYGLVDVSGQCPNSAGTDRTTRFTYKRNIDTDLDTGVRDKNSDAALIKKGSRKSTGVGVKNGVKDRQLILCQLGVLDSVMDILYAVTRPSGDIEPIFLELTRAAYTLMQSIITDLPKHQVLAAANMHLYLKHIRQNVGAEEAITALLENNVPLLEGRLGHLAVVQFLEHTKSFGISSSVLVFLAEACTTETEILEFNQRRICEAILSPRFSLLGRPPSSSTADLAVGSASLRQGFLRVKFRLDDPGGCRPWYSRRISTLLRRVESSRVSDKNAIMGAHLVQDGMMPVVVVDPSDIIVQRGAHHATQATHRLRVDSTSLPGGGQRGARVAVAVIFR